MFCPKCGTEYREGFTACADCGIPLVNELSSQTELEFIKPVTVYRTGDSAFIAYAESILQSEGIKCFTKGESLQELFAGGRLGTGYNPVIGPVEIQVDERDSERAKELLSFIEQDAPEPSNAHTEDDHSEEHKDVSTNKKHKTKDILIGIVVGSLVVSSIVLYLFPEYTQKHFSGVQKSDRDNDSKPDVFHNYENGVLVSSAEDRNFDGKIDVWFFCKNGIVDRGESDDNFDGKVDNWYFYRNGVLARTEIDTNFDNKPEIIEDYTNGVLSVKSWYHESSRSLWKKAYFVNGIMREEKIDRNYDGKFDLKISYDSSERPIKTELLL